MAGGQQGVGQDASLQVVGMAFGVGVFVHSLFPVSVCVPVVLGSGEVPFGPCTDGHRQCWERLMKDL